MRYAMRKDLNDADITQAVKAAGFSVIDYTKAGLGIPDKLAMKLLPQPGDYPGPYHFICWLEIKSKNGRLSEIQQLARQVWEPRGEWIEARTPEQTVNDLIERYNAKIKPEYQR
jgi:hypothetical protein